MDSTKEAENFQEREVNKNEVQLLRLRVADQKSQASLMPEMQAEVRLSQKNLTFPKTL